MTGGGKRSFYMEV